MKFKLIAPALIVLSAALAGCAGNGFTVTNYAGTYDGSGTVDRTKIGTLHFVTDSNGIINGTFVVSGTEGTGTGFNFTPGTYTIVGSLTSTGGGYTIAGTVADQGDFVIRGNFPPLSGTRPYTISANANTFTGTLGRTN